jgi:hypothetical protein
MKLIRLLAPAATAFLAACSSLAGVAGTSTTAAPFCGHPTSMMLIIGAHKNAPEPSLGSRLLCQVTTTIRAGLPVRIVVASGQPRGDLLGHAISR